MKDFNFIILDEFKSLACHQYNKSYSNTLKDLLLKSIDENDDLQEKKFYLSELILSLIKDNIKYDYCDEDIKCSINLIKNSLIENIDFMSSLIESYILGVSCRSDLYSYITKCKYVERSGWVNKPVPRKHLESIAEHMYECIHIVNMFVPKIYDLHKLTNIMMVHDLGETVTGDIPHPYKKPNDDLIEDLIVRGLLLGGSIDNFEQGFELYNSWIEWTDNITKEALLAHDIDVIQLNNQLLNYTLEHNDLFPISELKLWYRRRPLTELGLKIFDEVISIDERKVKLVNEILN